jgi:hypothetical protein
MRIDALDIHSVPINDTLWAQGKCGRKLIRNMAYCASVTASPIGVNA